MKAYLKILFFLLSSYAFSQPYVNNNQDPLLVVVLMVKNEAEVIEKTLEPFLKAGIDSYLILDTGSTDATISITRKLFLDYNIQHGYIIEQPFIDFSTSRNYALECAEKLFPNASFFFMLDAEWYLQNVDVFIKFCQIHAQETTPDTFAIQVYFENVRYYVKRLFRASKKIRFVGVVHEYAQAQSYKKITPETYIAWNASINGNNKSKARWCKDKELLLKEYKNDPTNLRTIYFLGQTCLSLQELPQAAYWYQKRYEQNDCAEEKFLACYRLGTIYEQLKDMPLALHYYTASHHLNPDRAEPLTAIALYYLQQSDYKNSFAYAQMAAATVYPQDALIFNQTIYSYTRYVVLACAAWYEKEYEIGQQALQKALDNYPDDTHLLEIAKMFQHRD